MRAGKPLVATHDCIVVVGVECQAMKAQYEPCGAKFLSVDEALDVRLPDDVRLMLVAQDSVTPKQKLAVKRRADSRRVSAVFVHNIDNIAPTLGTLLARTGTGAHNAASEREYVLSKIPDGYNFNVARVARSIRLRTHIDGFPHLEFNQIRKLVGQERTRRRKLANEQSRASGGRVLSWGARPPRPDPIEELLRDVDPMPVTPELAEKAKRSVGRCTTPKDLVKRLFNPSAECSDESQTKTLVGLVRSHGFMRVRSDVVFRIVAKLRKLAKELAVD
jgi:hypothetical protein